MLSRRPRKCTYAIPVHTVPLQALVVSATKSHMQSYEVYLLRRRLTRNEGATPAGRWIEVLDRLGSTDASKTNSCCCCIVRGNSGVTYVISVN